MERTRYHVPPELKAYELLSPGPVHTPSLNKKWWLGFCCAVLGVLLLLYLPVYHQLQTRIGEGFGDIVGMHSLCSLELFIIEFTVQ